MRSFAVQSLLALAAVAAGVAQCSPIAPEASSQPSTRVRFERRQDNSKYPPVLQPPNPSLLPQAWRDALNTAVSQGKIPNIPPTTVDSNGNVHYASNDLANSPDVCSWTTSKCNGQNDFWQAPQGTWVLGFDDGPTGYSGDLYSFLQAQNQPATHFMIGSQIVAFPDVFKQAVAANQEIAVHTWSHTLMTSRTNEELVGEFGWTMQIIYDLSGRVPTLWRPPQGDLDNRVRAVAEQIFGLKAVMWDAESNDWCIQQDGSIAGECKNTDPGNSAQSVANAVNKAIAQPKNPGVILLEHELTTPGIDIFKNAYPAIKQAGWNVMTASDALSQNWYFNAKDDNGQATPVDNMAAAHNNAIAAPAPSSSSAAPSSQSAPTSTAGPTSTNTKTVSTPGATYTTTAASTGSGNHSNAAASVLQRNAVTMTAATLMVSAIAGVLLL